MLLRQAFLEARTPKAVLPDDQRLLSVFLAEGGDVRPDDLEELGDDGRHPAEVPGAARPLEAVGEPRHLDERARPLRVDLLGLGGEDDVHPFLREHLDVAGEVARVACQVFVRPELRGIDEDRHDHEVVG